MPSGIKEGFTEEVTFGSSFEDLQIDQMGSSIHFNWGVCVCACLYVCVCFYYVQVTVPDFGCNCE